MAHSAEKSEDLVKTLRDTIVSLVRGAGPDLSARQLAVFLTCYLDESGQTVRGLAAALNVSKPAITRALDRLGELDLARRKVDPLDRRSVLVQRTPKGAAYLKEIRTVMSEAGPDGVRRSRVEEKTATVRRLRRVAAA
ncbi:MULTISPECIES: MarR family transcriptional regulator [Acetobacter]|jgi:DNA-binding MarR family transcriptional regulator|uniref:HTH marR-type domain-containing protein n=1 Tax=Acetobacter peroxydans TaxID=104098 RepID=A0A4Y3TQJ7_9PROT|nr:MarR family transcriptional regulator [Acetobacter peroxydans]MCH4092910.1 MarR family transcriptional regulator [Acetobacter peroxydans]MCH4142294.1 MarR family transcriptional regulator [Acetobacter peroxydans]MCI1394425.1 MarR family transcriptional regulator [Acetobacter peroxydans]MCI1411307.1 MarR family transcriptional regulator [Acetobacter peroxydans]MCI1440067.1 MarR family transcriptional regulator [Acetobacter peroxydans]